MDGTTIALGGEHTYRNVIVQNGGVINVLDYAGGADEGWLKITADPITVEASSSINADGRGYRGGAGVYWARGMDGEGPGKGEGSGGNGGGGGYGGEGGSYSTEGGRGGQPYGTLDGEDCQMGSGGGGGGRTEGIGGDGGGRIALYAQTVSLSGTISANGAAGQALSHGSYGGGGGSGGCILISGDSVSLSGNLEANGGASPGSGAGGGGGGRIKVFYDSLTNSAAFQVAGGTGGDDPALRDGKLGTVYLGRRTSDLRSLDVLWPKAGDTGIVKGSVYSITWDSQDAGSTVKIEVSTSPTGLVRQTVAAAEPNVNGRNTPSWTAPQVDSSNCYIRITSNAYSNLTDTDGPFNIGNGSSYFTDLGVLGYWPLNGNAVDASAHGLNGTARNTPETLGRFGSCYDFRGILGLAGSSRIELPAYPQSDALSFSAWVKIDAYPEGGQYTQSYVILDRRQDYADQYLYVNQTGQIGFHAVRGSGNRSNGALSTATLPLGGWHHIVGAMDAVRTRIYLDGQNVADEPPAGPIYRGGSYYCTHIGAHSDLVTTLHYLNGRIDELAVFGRVLSDSEMAALANDSDGDGVADFRQGYQPPDQPHNTAPANGATTATLTPTLQASTFSEPGTANTHRASQWQVRETVGQTILDTGETQTDLTALTVPVGTLRYGTQYSWRVRYEDNLGVWSPWSDETSFTTQDSLARRELVFFDLDGDIWAMNADGSEATALTRGPAFDSCPRLNSTGSRIPFSSDRGRQYQIWTMRTDGTGLQVVGGFQSGNPLSIAWSPDDRTFVVAAQGDSVWLVEPDGSAVRRLAQYPECRCTQVDWGNSGLIVVTVEPKAGAGSGSMKLAGNARIRASEEGESSVSEIHSVNPSDGKDTLLVSDGVTPVLSRDGSALLFSTGGDVWILDIGTGSVRNLTNTPDQTEQGAVFSADGGKIVYRRYGSDSTVQELSVANSDRSSPIVLQTMSGEIGSLALAEYNAGTNAPPAQPVNSSPASGTPNVPLDPLLGASSFSDPDVGDTHLHSHWQVRTVDRDYADAVIDDTSATALTQYPVGPSILRSGQTYGWRVRYMDNHGNASAWSGETTFTTAVAPLPSDRVVIVAGGGNYTGNAIVDQTKFLAGYTYRLSVNRQIPKNHILLLSAFPDIDADGDGELDVNLPATRANLLAAMNPVTGFAAGADKVIVYFADLHSLATAVEAYAADWNHVPMNDGRYNIPPVEITTPVAYLSTNSLIDPFSNQERHPLYGELARYYAYMEIVDLPTAMSRQQLGRPVPKEAIDNPFYHSGAFAKYGAWRLVGNGPDRSHRLPGFTPGCDPEDPTDITEGTDVLYDPSNGSVSTGNILRTQRHSSDAVLRQPGFPPQGLDRRNEPAWNSGRALDFESASRLRHQLQEGADAAVVLLECALGHDATDRLGLGEVPWRKAVAVIGQHRPPRKQCRPQPSVGRPTGQRGAGRHREQFPSAATRVPESTTPPLGTRPEAA